MRDIAARILTILDRPGAFLAPLALVCAFGLTAPCSAAPNKLTLPLAADGGGVFSDFDDDDYDEDHEGSGRPDIDRSTTRHIPNVI